MVSRIARQAQFLSVAFLLAAGCVAQAQDGKTIKPEGTWTITKAATLEGQAYGGMVEISKQGAAYKVQWETEAGSYPGIGLFRDNHLFVGWGADESTGVVVYKIGKDGTLDGEWTYDMAGGVGTEQATGGRRGQVEGTYQLTGKNPDGTAYEGNLEIAKSGQVYLLAWSGNADRVDRGIGIKVGDRLVVGYGPVGGGMISWKFTDNNTAEGTWTTDGADTTAVENLKRQ